MHVLASGSSGNATFVSIGDTRLLVDAGISLKAMLSRLSHIGEEAAGLDAVILTHEHGDHVRGLPALRKLLPELPVLATRGTARGLGRSASEVVRRPYLSAGTPTAFGVVKLTPIEVAHDAAEPIGLRLDCGDLSVGIATDLGVATLHVQQMLSGCRALVVEANHDEEMLRRGPYPGFLKRRIASTLGHLSNDQTARLLQAVAGPKLEYVVLAHLSRTNNTPQTALAAAAAGMGVAVEAHLHAASHRGDLEPWESVFDADLPSSPQSSRHRGQPRLFE